MRIFASDLPWYWDKILTLVVAVIQAIAITILTKIIVDSAITKKQKIGASLNKEGVQRVVSSDGKLTKQDINLLFGYGKNPVPKEINLCFLSGVGFIRKFYSDLKHVILKGCNVKILLADPRNSHFYNKYKNGETITPEELAKYYSEAYLDNYSFNDSFLEKEDFMIALGRKNFEVLEEEELYQIFLDFFTKHQTNDSVHQIFQAMQMVDNLKLDVQKQDGNGVAGNIEVRFYKDEYRMPITLAKFEKTEKKSACVMLWTSITAPIEETADSISLFFSKNDSDDGKFVESIESTFSYLWDYYK